MKHIAAAIETLEGRRTDLTEGINNITAQQEHLDQLRKQIEKAEKNLVADKQALIEVDNALALLQAGEQA